MPLQITTPTTLHTSQSPTPPPPNDTQNGYGCIQCSLLKPKFEPLFGGADNINLSKSLSKFKLLIDILYSKPHQSIAAGDISLAKVISVFGLHYNPEPTYELGQPDPHAWSQRGTSD